MIEVLQIRRLPAFTLAITVVLASVAAACGDDGSSEPDGSADSGFATTTLPPLAPDNDRPDTG